MWKKKDIDVKATLDMCEILLRDRFNQPKILYLANPPRGIFATGNGKHTYTILTHKPVETSGEGANLVVDKTTISFIKALCITGLVQDRKL